MITKIIILQFTPTREKELALMSLPDRSKPSFLVVTGKRRVGKTELKAFSSGKEVLKESVSGMELRTGIAARKIEGRESIEREGFLVWEPDDLLR